MAAAPGAAPRSAGEAPSGLGPADLAEARQHFDAAMQAERSGDWARYGEEIRLLGQVLERAGAGPVRPSPARRP